MLALGPIAIYIRLGMLLWRRSGTAVPLPESQAGPPFPDSTRLSAVPLLAPSPGGAFFERHSRFPSILSLLDRRADSRVAAGARSRSAVLPRLSAGSPHWPLVQ